MRERMKENLAFFVRELVEDKESVCIDLEEDRETITLKIRLAEKDRGAVIGVNGKRIKALKEVIHMEGFKTGKKVRLEVI
ncbi:MAG TPA: KH domain-containing protein [Firmicutes bacterium]|nr:KH domain-containing protein [Bacillota bacterium]